MSRQPRLVVPDHPHHVTQRGNRRQPVFFCDDDYTLYLDLLRHWAGQAKTEIWAYCLMPNHVHLILTPSTPDGLRAALGETHRRYTRHINLREGWRGHLWQERFHSFVMDEPYVLACARYVALNPVAAGLVARPEDWAWSSARAHLEGKSDGAVALAPLATRVDDWATFFDDGVEDAMTERLDLHLRTGRPLGDAAFIDGLVARFGEAAQARPRGRPARSV